ncbi:MAG: hypothetical protein KAJ24_00895, partial [Candidatus Aenigmarchaeota archaeon]|nr:hypothetical protein [Candidatus Aenigmarchaeota archaeon]
MFKDNQDLKIIIIAMISILTILTIAFFVDAIHQHQQNTEFLESLDLMCIEWASEDGDTVSKNVIYDTLLAIHLHGTCNTTIDGVVVSYITKVRKNGYGGWSTYHEYKEYDDICNNCWNWKRTDYNDCVKYAIVSGIWMD